MAQDNGQTSVLTLWVVHAQPSGADQRTYLVPLAVGRDGKRLPALEKRKEEMFRRPCKPPSLETGYRRKILSEVIEPMLQRELQHRGIASERGGYAVELVAWIEAS